HSKGALAITPFTSKLSSGDLEGEVTTGDKGFALALDFKNLPLQALRSFGGPHLAGSAGGSIRLRGSPQNPEGHVEIRLKDIGVGQLEVVELPPGTLEVTADLRKERLYADVSLQGLTAKPFEASLDLPLRLSLSPLSFSLPAQRDLLGTLRGEVELARVAALLAMDDQKLEGRVDIRLGLGGTWKDLRLTGDALLDKGAYENLRTGTVLREIEVQIAADKSQLRLERARATDGEKGTVSAQGWMDLRPAQGFPFKAELSLKQARPFRHDAARATAGGRLTLSGNLSEALLAGQIVVESAEFNLPERLPPEITDLNVIEIHGGGEETQTRRQGRSGQSNRLLLDVSVLSHGRTFVAGRGLDSEWQGGIRLSGKAGDPVLAGKLSVVRGRFNFLGKRFNLTKGSITFHGTVPASPTLDVLAEAHAKDMTAFLHLSGPALSPEVKLSSEPVLPSDEILSRLLFGRSVTQITPLQALTLANAVKTLAGGGGFDFMGRTRKWLGLDQLEIKQSGDNMEEAAVSAGKYLSDTIYLEVEQGVGPGSGKASVQWEITPNITVETEVGANAQGGGGVNWKWDY
ncbi:MAG: translocation/assembly module TamB domain-containing protein, partial [Pseudomonadota bacterium]